MDRKQKPFHNVVLEQMLDKLCILPVCLPEKYVLRTVDKCPQDSRLSVWECDETLE